MAGAPTTLITLSNHEYKNWVKAGLSLLFTRDGIETFVVAGADQFHQASVGAVPGGAVGAVPGGAACRSCTTEKVLPCPTRGICNDRGPCRYHDATDPNKASTPCSSSVCDRVGRQIVRAHRYGRGIISFSGPSWVNTDARLWNTNSWELAKCFMSPGYTSVPSAAETDFPGSVSVVINHTDFQNVVSADLTNNTNIFRQARDVRNTILHSATMQITDVELSSYITTLKGMLSDPLGLAADPRAQNAITQLTQIENGSLTITARDEALVRAEALRAIEDKKIEAIQAVQAEGQVQVENVKKDILTEYDNRVKLFNALSQQFLEELTKQTDDGKKQIQNVAKVAVDTIKKVAETEKVTAIGEIRQVAGTENVTAVDNIRQEAETEKDGIRQMAKDGKETAVIDIKQLAGTEKHGIKQVAGTEKHDIKQVAGTEKHDIKQVAVTEKHDIRQVAGTEKHDIKQVAGTEKHDIKQVAKTEKKNTVVDIRQVARTEKHDIKQVATTEKEIAVVEIRQVARTEKHDIKQVATTEKETAVVDIRQVAETEKHDIKQSAGTEKHEIKQVAKTEKETAVVDIRQVAGTERGDIRQIAGNEKHDIKQVAGTEKDGITQEAKIEKDTAVDYIRQVVGSEKKTAVVDIRQVAGTEKHDIKQVAKTEKETAVVDIRQMAETEKETAVVDIRQVAGTEKDDIRQVAGTESKIAVKTIRKVIEDAVGTMKHISEKKYRELKQNFQKDLIEFYKDDHLTVPINPLKIAETADIADLYAEPCMRQVDPHNKSSKGSQNINSYENIFKKGEQMCKKIYIAGEAGSGKSTFCQHLVASWCRSHSEHVKLVTKVEKRIKKDEEAMRKFDFVFYITLRDVTGSHNHVEEIIKDRLLKSLDESYSSILSKVLQTEQCLIILDGLDEWTPKNESESSRCCTKGIPDRTVRRNCSIITTTRPWKLEHMRLKTSEIDQQIELSGLDESSSRQLIENAVTVLNRKYGKNTSADDFEKKLWESNVAALRCIPVILKQLLCLWHAGKPFGNSKCSIYSGMINLLFQLAEDKNLKDNRKYSKMKEGNASSKLQFPKCFNGNKKCEELKPFVYALAKLSFETLFTNSKEESLVFENSTAEMHGMSKLQIDISSEIGILSQSKILIDCSTESKKLSFIHKTFQEFLAGMYVSMNEETIGTITNICNSVEKMLEMEQVLVFISGMNPETAGKLSECICEMASRDPRLMEHRETLDRLDEEYQDLIKIRDTMSSCVRESSNNGHQTKLRIEDIIIDMVYDDEKLVTHLENLIRSNSSNIRCLYIRHIKTPCSLTEAIIQVDSLQKLCINQDLTAIPVDLVYNLACKSKDTLQCLVLNGYHPHFDLSELSQIHFSSMMQPSSNMVALRFSTIRLSHYQVECLMSFLSQSKHMRQVHLDDIECAECEDDACRYQLDLSGHTQLEILELKELYVERVQVNTTSLVKLNIVDLYTPGALASVMNSVSNAPKLQQFQLRGRNSECLGFRDTRGIDDPRDVDTLVAVISTLIQLKEIHLSDIEFGDRELRLPHSMDIKHVTLQMVTMTSKSLQSFVASIPYTQHSVKIEVMYILIGPVDETAFNCVRHSQRFVVDIDSGIVGLKCLLYYFHTVQKGID